MGQISQADLKKLPDIDEPMAFRDVTELAELLLTPAIWDDNASTTGNKPSQDWDLSCGWDGAVEMLAHGWAAGAEKIQRLQMASGFSIAPRRKLDRNVSGFLPCVGAAMAGDPRAMFTRPKKPMRTPVVNLVFNQCANSNVDAAYFENAGVACLSLVSTLESMGVSVGLYVGYTIMGTNYGDGGRKSGIVRWEVPVKRPGQPLDIERLAFLVAHPAMFRRIGFAYIERLTLEARKWLGSGYGKSCNHKVIVADGHLLPELAEDTDAYETPAKAIETVLAWWATTVKTLNL